MLQVIIFERGDLVFVFNFHPENTYDGYKVGCDLPGKYRVALDSDAGEFCGRGRVGHDVDHFTSPEGIPGVPEINFNNRPNSFKVLSPPRTRVAYYVVPESEEEITASDLVGADKTLAADVGTKHENFEASAPVEDGNTRPSEVERSETEETTKIKEPEAEETGEGTADE